MTRLFINWFNEANNERRGELELALGANIQLPFIDLIVNVSDTAVPAWATGKVQHVNCTGRPAYQEIFNVINQLAQPQDISVLANLDIYFDQTLALAGQIKANQCFALTRYNMVNGKPVFYNNAWSQDSWIFRGPIRKVDGLDFGMGYLGCDNKLVWLLSQHQYEVSNPSKTIFSYHLHKSDKRAYLTDKGERIAPLVIPGPYLTLEPTNL